MPRRLMFIFDVNNKMVIISYSILNYDEIHKDVMARSKVLVDYRTLIEKRMRIEVEYLMKMNELVGLPEMRKIPNATKTTELIYNSLVNALNYQKDTIANHVSRMETQITKLITNSLCDLDNQSKKELINAGTLIQNYEKKHQEFQRSKNKLIKRAFQLKKLKQEYIVGTLTDMPFDKKNKLFIRTKQFDDSFKPMKEDLQKNLKLFNEKAVEAAQKLQKIIERVQKLQNQKVQVMKNVFMVLQISNSEFGANLIKQKNQIMNKINHLQTANPQFLKMTPEQSEKCKKHLLVQMHDPSCYVSKLFSNVFQTKNFNALVQYGREEGHKQSISSSLSDSNITHLNDSEADSTTIKTIVFGFRNIFEEGIEFDMKKHQKLKQLLKGSPECRKNFILCLQRYRKQNVFVMPLKKLQHIANAINEFLDFCMQQMDTYNSKQLLVLSLTYYVLIGEERTDLHEYIQQHKIWKDKQWWECAVLQDSYQKIKVNNMKKIDDDPITIWDIKGSGLRRNDGENQITGQQILFNQLYFYVYNMGLVQVKEEYRTYLAKKYFKYFQLQHKRWSDFESMLKEKDVVIEDMDCDLGASTGSPISWKKKPVRKFF